MSNLQAHAARAASTTVADMRGRFHTSRLAATGLLAMLVSGCSPHNPPPTTTHDAPAVPARASAASTAVAPDTYTARGNEPGWRLWLGAEHTRLEWNYGADELSWPTPPAQTLADGTRYVGHGRHAMQIVIRDQLCHDSMTGMPYPDTVTVRIQGSTLHGCGGQPRELLTGGTWRVEDINRGGVIDNSHITLEFDHDGHISGHTSCNSYTGRYRIDGESLHIDQLEVTERACVPALGKQERRFLGVLRHARRFDIGEHGKLLLTSATGKSLVAVHTGG